MNVIFLKEVSLLKEMILRLAVDVEHRLTRAVKAIRDRDDQAALEIVKTDNEIDEREVRIEEECLKVLALHQPVASDMRFIIFVLKVDNDLERIADLSVNIAKRVPILAGEPVQDIENRIDAMAHMVSEMQRTIIEAVIEQDQQAAESVRERDKEVDKLHRAIHATVLERVSDPAGAASARALVTLLNVSRDLERVGDHVTNIAEDLLYLERGRIVRHRD